MNEERCEMCGGCGRIVVAPAALEGGMIRDEIWDDCPECTKVTPIDFGDGWKRKYGYDYGRPAVERGL